MRRSQSCESRLLLLQSALHESATRFVGVHGERTWDDLGKFYTAMNRLFAGGRLGGVGSVLGEAKVSGLWPVWYPAPDRGNNAEVGGRGVHVGGRARVKGELEGWGLEEGECPNYIEPERQLI